ncbi:Mo-dependent nitrogenase C-terminal domain-containing protein [Leptolyngbya sp. AN02str]|uniref:Mo-dependent nitrogenase C-terminal domain-containing protein n=1 Tax=Leptolyngbya sp. AN02str TaxID=3423363 RepID=UPI003D311A32
MFDSTTRDLALVSWVALHQPSPEEVSLQPASSPTPTWRSLLTADLLLPLRRYINQIEVNTPELAHKLCQLIPSQCPFERDISVFGKTLLHIPPLCKLNPFYEEVVALRFRALCYLADECGVDISCYC